MSDTVQPATARFLVDRPRQKTIALEWPIEVGGVQYREISVKRLTTGEVDAFIELLTAAPKDAKPRWPVFDVAGNQVSDAVWTALDPDDSDRIGAALNDFLPARFRAAMTDSVSIPTTSSNGGNTSAA